MKRSALLLTIIISLIGSNIQAYNKTITGQVTDKEGNTIAGVNVVIKNTTTSTVTDINGKYSIQVNSKNDVLLFSFIGMVTKEVKVAQKSTINVTLQANACKIQEVVVMEYESEPQNMLYNAVAGVQTKAYKDESKYTTGYSSFCNLHEQNFNTENYASISENGYKQVTKEPLSTFAVDVDRASYTNIRRFLNNGQLPPADAVRIEEMINYFSYDYKAPDTDHPFSVNSEMATCPWNNEHYLLKVGLKSKEIKKDNLPPSNLVFLIDVSGSMNSTNKLPLLKSSFRLLVNELRPEDRVSIVVYAGAAGLVLEPTTGDNKKKILEALDKLQAGGSTAGGAGLKLAYKTAKEYYQKQGNNRIILATDGDFNVGQSSNSSMEDLVEEERKNGIYMTVLGFGMGNYKDDRMEIIADKGNGNYAYIDNLQEAQKTLVSEFGGTLFTIAKDVKFQIEFNPSKILAYRLIGYENRLLNDEDFNDDSKDAGEIGAGHTVTALYELIPVGAEDSNKWVKSVDKLKYQDKRNTIVSSNEWLTLKLRYKLPDSSKSQLIEKAVQSDVNNFTNASNDLRFAASVAGFGMLLRNSKYKGNMTYDYAQDIGKNARGNDEYGFKAEMVRLIKTAKSLSSQIAINE